MTRTKIIAFVIGLGLILIAVFNFGFGSSPIVPVVNNETQPPPQSSEPALISSDPPELFKKIPMIFKPDQIIKLNFNIPLQNGPETKLKIDPPHEVEIKLSDDYKSAIITPKTPYKLGQGYTIFVKADTKLQEPGKTLGKDYDLHFNVINYSGI